MMLFCRQVKNISSRSYCYFIYRNLLTASLTLQRKDNSNIIPKIFGLKELQIQKNYRFFSSESLMNLNEYQRVAEDTLEELADFFDELADDGKFGDEYDLILADGVMTINLGIAGTYVINKQTPNRQIWLSSPVSGPKRYDFIDNTWQYLHEADVSLHDLLSREITAFRNENTDFTQLVHGTKTKR